MTRFKGADFMKFLQRSYMNSCKALINNRNTKLPKLVTRVRFPSPAPKYLKAISPRVYGLSLLLSILCDCSRGRL